MNCNVGFLVFVAVLGITLWHPTETTSGEAFVEVVDGKCIYQNRTLEHHQSIQFESPCQAWFCNADSHKVYIGGCTPNPPLENCVEVSGNGTYPDCCPRLVCDRQHAE
uniref:Putative 8.9 kDa family member n=1 Tax=Rhipicephalus pulchellus TaxID=72859 RepID=L7LQY6_RHIPC